MHHSSLLILTLYVDQIVWDHPGGF